MIKAFIFDIDGVLLDSADSVYAYFCEILSEFNYPVPSREVFNENFHRTTREQLKIYTGNLADDIIEPMWQVAKERSFNYDLMTAPEFSADIIAALAKEYPLGVVSNKLKKNLFNGKHMGSLQPYFKVGLGYDDVQNPKPHPEPLLLAAKKLGVEPDECVYIGDMPSDLTAGKAAGMKVIIFGKNKIPGADAYADAFSQLPALITKL